jgi:hypothetical protein
MLTRQQYNNTRQIGAMGMPILSTMQLLALHMKGNFAIEADPSAFFIASDIVICRA